MQPGNILLLAFVLAFLVESLVEYFFGTLCDQVPGLVRYRWALIYVAAIMGLLVTGAYQVDLIALIWGGQITWPGIILTGLIVGRGSNFLHSFVTTFLKPKPVIVTTVETASSPGPEGMTWAG